MRVGLVACPGGQGDRLCLGWNSISLDILRKYECLYAKEKETEETMGLKL